MKIIIIVIMKTMLIRINKYLPYNNDNNDNNNNNDGYNDNDNDNDNDKPCSLGACSLGAVASSSTPSAPSGLARTSKA